MYIKYDKPIVGRDPMGRPLPHWRAELARGWAHFCAPHPMLLIYYIIRMIYKLYV